MISKDEIIRMARLVGYPIQHPEWVKAAEEFASLVQDHTQEQCAKVCEARKIDGLLVHSNAVLNCAAAIRAMK